MKKTILIILAASTLCLFAFTHEIDKSAAKAEQIEGKYIFILSKPTQQYKYLGSVKKTISLTGQPQELINSIVKKVKKEYPTADGIIFKDLELSSADAIMFNNNE